MKTVGMIVFSLTLAAATGPAIGAPFPSGVPGGGKMLRSDVVRVQSGDAVYRIGQLEEEIRTLNGRIEELGFQMLQMQEQMRQMQEDNEFRFQQLEKGGPGAGNGKRSDAGPAAGGATGPAGVEETTTSSTGTATPGTPPQTLGTLTFDDSGNVRAPADGGAGSETAALDTPEDLYQAGYNHMLAGDYQLAEQVFRDYVDIHPEGAQAADAMFWLGEAQYSQGHYTDAAKTFLDAHKRFPQADKGPDTMLKLGMSLAALNKRENACATYREVLIRYPGASAAVKSKVSQEQARASC